MRALVLTAYKQLELHTDFPEPELQVGEVLIQVEAVGICGSDIHGYDGSTGRRIPPLVMGHEAAGTILAVGAHVAGLEVGQKVALDSTVFCNRCEMCRQGRINLCDHRQVLGVSCGEYRRHGAFAQRVAVPAHVAYPIPAGVSMEQAALAEAVSVAIHAAKRSQPQATDPCLVLGAGMIGLLVVQSLRALGIRNIAAIDRDPHRLALAERFGANLTVLAEAADLEPRVLAWSGQRGPQHVYEVVGAQATIERSIQIVRKGGHVVLVGNLTPRVEVPLQRLVAGEITLHGSCASAGEYREALQWMSDGRMDVQPIISAKCSLDDAAQWIERLYQGVPNTMKVVVCPNCVFGDK